MYHKRIAPVLKLSTVLCLFTMVITASCDSASRKPSAIIPEEETIAVVNNKRITMTLFQARLHSFLQHYRDLITSDEKQLGEIKNIVISQLIDEELITQEASRKGIQVQEEEMESIIAESLSSYEQANFEAYLRGTNYTEEEWKGKLQYYLIQKKLISEEVITKIPITKAEITSYYQQNRNNLVREQALKVRNITLSTEEEATAILSQLNRGRNFLELIRQHSISPDKAWDGDLGFIERGDLPEEMESEIFDKKFARFSPRYTDVIRSQDGFHVLRLEQYRPLKRLSVDEASPQIKQILIKQKWDQYYNQWIEQLRERATITINQAMLQREKGF